MKLEMSDVAGDEDEIERAFAADLVGDVDLAALCVKNVRDFHGEQCLPRTFFAQRPKKVERTGIEPVTSGLQSPIRPSGPDADSSGIPRPSRDFCSLPCGD